MSSKNFMSYEDATTVLGGYANAIKNKQGALTAGSHIAIDDDTIFVNRWAVPAGDVIYTVITGSGDYGREIHVQRHTVGGTLIDDRQYNIATWGAQDVDGKIRLAQGYAQWNISLLADSKEYSAGYSYNVNPNTTETSNSFTFTLTQEENDNDLIIREELDTKQDTLTFDDTPTANSNNPVKSGGVKSAIDAAVASAYHHAGTKTCAELVAGLLVAGNEGNVYNMTDSGTTTADFIDGAGQPIKAGDNVGIAKISDGVYNFDLLSGFVDTSNFVQKSVTAGLIKNDGTIDTVAKQPVTDNSLTTTDKTIVGAVNELKSGLTNLDGDIDAPNKKNFLQNNATSATQPSGITYIVYDDGSVKVEGEATDNSNFTINYPFTREGNYILSGCPSGGSTTGYSLEAFLSSSKYVKDTGNGVNVTVGSGESWRIRITVASGTVIPEGGITFYPMLRLSTVSDATYAPYIPSVESRIKAVESGNIDVYTTDADIISKFYNKPIGFKCIALYDSTKTMTILNTIDHTSAFVLLMGNDTVWKNHPNVAVYVGKRAWIGVLTITDNAISFNSVAEVATVTQ